MCVWGASDGAHLDATADAFPAPHQLHLDVDAGRSVDRALGVPALGGFPSVLMVLLPDGPARNKPGAAPSAE